MTTPSPAVIVAAVFLFHAAVLPPPPSAHALGGSANTIAVVYGAATTICSIAANRSVHQIQCWRNGQLLPPLFPATSFDAVAGGRNTLCGVRSPGFSLLCWDNNFTPKRIYNNLSAPVTSLTIGDTQICALRKVSNEGNAFCWRGDDTLSIRNSDFRMISSGLEISCGVVENNNQVLCWGDDFLSRSLQSQFANSSMENIHVGGRHACGINDSGLVICRGDNSNNQLNVPSNSPYEYEALALGANHTCAIRKSNHTVVCWGGNGEFSSNITDGIGFESIVAGLNFTCGLITGNFSVMCWGPGWINQYPSVLPLQRTLPGPCIDSNTSCPCSLYPDSDSLCSGNGHICRPCDIPISIPPISPPPISPPTVSPSPSHSRRLRRGLLAFAIIGSVGGFAGICTIIYCLWTGICFGKKKIHNSVQPTITPNNNNASAAPHSRSSSSSRSSTLRRQASILMRRQRSGTSNKHPDKAEEFSFPVLATATNNFSLENKIGAGSFGIIYRGKLLDGREVAIKRSESLLKKKKFQESETAFESELTFLSRLHHRHLVRLVGFCIEKDERLLVYEYMKNGALYDHLHNKNNVENSSSLINSWKIRIKISLDAARGIEYLHNYAVPPIIHRDIKSSNILLDANWNARVSDFGLSLMGTENNSDYRPMKAAGTIGYIDPEYYGLNVVTVKSDVYGLGVVLLEILTGKKAIFKTDSEGEPIAVVDYALPAIMAGELSKILDTRVGLPDTNEAEAVELVAYTAMHCVHLEGKDRPTMTDIVGNLERALFLCENSHGSMSSDRISIALE